MPYDDELKQVDAMIARFAERNKEEIEKALAKPQPQQFEAIVSLKLLAQSSSEAADKLKFLCENLQGFDDIVKADGEIV